MGKISLYIDDQLVELNDKSFILFNYTQDEASNPTIVKNSYSQEIEIPGTAKNNEIFGRMYRLDRITSFDSFNPIRKTPFKICNELNEILESGYVKLNKITRNNEDITYSVSLYGGLGGFFYNLMYNEDGSKKTLGNLWLYNPANPINPINPKDYEWRLTASVVRDAWAVLRNGTENTFHNLINYAPCNNGFPGCKFDANKAVVQNASNDVYPNIYGSTADDDGNIYSPKVDDTILLEMENKHTEWEIQDLRAYLQRPIISLRYLLQSFTLPQNTGEYRFEIDEYTIATDANPYYWSGWMTLPMFDRDHLDPSQFELYDLLKGTSSPAEYIIGFAKIMGCQFVFDSATNTIRMTGRNNYYMPNRKIVDISKRIDRSRGIVPNTMESRHYVWDNPKMFGEYAAEYEAKFGRQYGSQSVNTGYEFNAEKKKVMEGIVYNGAVDVLESNANFRVYGGFSDPMTGVYSNYLFKFGISEKVSWKLYANLDNQLKELPCEPLKDVWLSPFNYSGNATDFTDLIDRPQMHSADNKAEAGSNVLLFYNNEIYPPVYREGGYVIATIDFHLSDDSLAMRQLNANVPCWDVSLDGANIIPIESMPRFNRYYEPTDGEIYFSWDFGASLEVANRKEIDEDVTIYPCFWGKYIGDKFDLDTKVVTLKVDLSGLKVDSNLLREFFYFENCIWVLNKITNHSITTNDLTECEFIRVKDVSNYDFGQFDF